MLGGQKEPVWLGRMSEGERAKNRRGQFVQDLWAAGRTVVSNSSVRGSLGQVLSQGGL